MPTNPPLPPPDDAPYHLKTFVWLMENSSAKDYYSEGQLREIAEAIKSKDEDTLKRFYPDILRRFAEKRNANIYLALQEEFLTMQFQNGLNEIRSEHRHRQEDRHQEIEAEEHASADEILNQL